MFRNIEINDGIYNWFKLSPDRLWIEIETENILPIDRAEQRINALEVSMDLLLTHFLYLLPFLRYLLSKFVGFDLDLSLHIVPFLKYFTTKFLGFDLDLWPLEVTLGQKYFCHSKAPT